MSEIMSQGALGLLPKPESQESAPYIVRQFETDAGNYRVVKRIVSSNHNGDAYDFVLERFSGQDAMNVSMWERIELKDVCNEWPTSTLLEVFIENVETKPFKFASTAKV